jgi:YVTN family beta-propeller protein
MPPLSRVLPLGALAVCVLGAPCALSSQATPVTPSPALLVLSKGDQALYIVDPAKLQPVGHVPSGPDPHEVIPADDGRTAYISNYGGGAYHTLTPVDLVSQRALPAIELGALRGPHGLVFVGGKVWFTAEGSKVVGRFDPTTQTIDWVLGTGQDRTHMLYVFPDGSRVLTTNVSSATVTLAEQTVGQRFGPPGPPLTDWRETVIPVGAGAEGFDVTPDGKEAWVANARDGTISVIDLAARRVVQTIAADVPGANRLKLTPDGRLAFVSALGSPNVTVLSVATRAVTKRIPVGRGSAGILVQPDGARVYVACTPDDSVAVIDVRSLTVVARIGAGRQPDGLAWAVRR